MKITILLKAVYRFNAIPVKIPMRLHRTRTNNYKICVETQKTRIAKTILRRTELKVTCSLSPGYYKAILIKTKWYWHRTDTDQ